MTLLLLHGMVSGISLHVSCWHGCPPFPCARPPWHFMLVPAGTSLVVHVHCGLWQCPVCQTVTNVGTWLRFCLLTLPHDGMLLMGCQQSEGTQRHREP
eukprot:353268-Chlamydomonas_euryale.AAC.12